MEVRLKVVTGANAGQELLIPGPKFFIGRAEDCHLRPRSDLISRHHCVLMLENDFVAVRDFGSKNGTIVNDERVIGEQELKSGDRLRVGPLEFEVSVVVAAPSKKRPKVESVLEAATRTAEDSARKSSGAQVDVSEWLAPGEKTTAAETRVMATNETSEIDVSAMTLPGLGKAPEKAETETVSESRRKPPEKKPPGKLPTSAKTTTADSKNAAAESLNKFFKRR